ncbi:hypothetical protein BD309DRAFT_1007501 [Dichomitus squalens]|nr:hypothetical protein BD309DRAFT_1007501 [Dichomitus squalens]
MFLLAFAHFALNLHIMFDINPANVEDRNMPLWYGTIGKAKFVIYVTQTIIGDSFMVYRLYIVWDRWWQALVFPRILLCCDAARDASVALGYAALWTKSIPPQYHNLIHHQRSLHSIHYEQGFTVQSQKGIIQSAAVYSAASIVLVITAFESPNVGYVACLNIFPALIGLLSSSIVIRLGLQARQESYLPVFQSVPLQIPVASPSAAHHDSCATPLSP